MPYADASVTGWCNLFHEVNEASSYFTASNLSAPIKDILTEADHYEGIVISSLLSNFSFNNLITEVLPIFSRLAISDLLNPFPPL